MDGLLLLLWHKEQRAAGAGAAGYGVAAATPLTLRNSIIPGEERKSIRSTSQRNCVRNGSRFAEKINPIKNSTDRSAKKASTNTGTAVCETLIDRESGRERKTGNYKIK